MTTATATRQTVEARSLAIGDVTDKGPITRLLISWDAVLITTEGTNPHTGAKFSTGWGVAPTHFVWVTR